jgi:two-component system OmpR family response regulator
VHRRVLIVDDETTMRLTLSYLLRKAGYEVTTCASAAEALELARTSPDLVLLGDVGPADLEQPGGSGIIREIKKESSGSRLIVLTADHSPELRRRALAEGADGYCEKPMDVEKLLMAIRSLEQPI